MKPNEKPEKTRANGDGKSRGGPCETCLYFDVLDESGAEGCTVDVDEDEAYREYAGAEKGCPYYRFYDEYKLVQKQN
ncbi:MAG: hypothetical protein E7576_06125 [Ruminococcaceae bacterium]|jgi:hypothetical protein|nr:hypothetical protein [Oscillospiraceae bacterium]